MKVCFALPLACVLLAPIQASGRPADLPVTSQGPQALEASQSGHLADRAVLSAPEVRADTVWFGGFNEATGQAYNSVDDGYETAVWTWDAGTTDPLEGWTKRDLTEDLRTYFSRVVADSFTSRGDPYTPMFPAPSTAQIWVGVHEDEAMQLSWELGMGYGNNSCQKATSPRYAISAGQDIQISFKYFQDSEIEFDYTYIYVLTYDAGDVLKEIYEVGRLDAKFGTYQFPANYASGVVPYAGFDPAPAKVELQFKFAADWGWSDEDGDYSCDYGPFSADDIHFVIGATDNYYDFESGDQGWTYEKCPGVGVGAYMDVCTEAEWSTWILGPPAVACPCDLSANALYCATVIPSSLKPGHFVGHEEYMISPIVDREDFTSVNGWYNVVVRWDSFDFLRIASGTFYRPGFFYFPYTTPEDPRERWSPRSGQTVWLYTGQSPICVHNRLFSLTVPADGTPLPYNWELMKYAFQVTTDCTLFGIEIDCKKGGVTNGAPVYDNVRVGITGGVNAPGIVLETGHLFHDGFGQLSPYYLDPGDVCNSDVAYDHSRNNYDQNDWLADTAAVNGPPVTLPEYTYWIDLCFKVAQKGPRQDWIPGYTAWKARLTGDPEADFVCALMDTAMVLSGTEIIPVDNGQTRVTYFHEDDPAFDPNYDDRTPEQEILPDLVFTPGTRIEYYWRSYWAQNPAGCFTLPANAPSAIPPGPNVYEIEFLPMMELDESTGGDYDVIWPSVLYVDGFNGGGENFLIPVFDQLGIAFDKFDRLSFLSNYDASMRRSFGLGFYNPGGWGNNGCTLEQLMGYRLILLSMGPLGFYSGEGGDYTLLQDWLETTDCGAAGYRRGLIFNGDDVAEIMGDPDEGEAISFFTNVLGVTLVDYAYRDYNADDFDCVHVIGASGGEFAPAAPLALYGNACPLHRGYSVIGPTPGIGAVGNLSYEPGSGAVSPTYPQVDFAQVVRESPGGPGSVGGWKTVVDGFNLHHLSRSGYGSEECSGDSAAVLAGMLDLLAPELAWLSDGGAEPFVPWRYPCDSVGIDEENETHLSGPVNYLYPSKPNPFRGSVAIRFSLAQEGPIRVVLYDVTGRVVRVLHDGNAAAGETSLAWDGTDDAGRRLGNGIYWVKLIAENYLSSGRIVVLE